jgi:hypothetical protein
MTDRSPKAHHDFNRRELLRGGALVGLGALGLTVAPQLAGTALAVATSVNIDGVAYPVQAGWWHCFYCGSLFSSPTAINAGVCPAGGPHSKTAGGGSGQYLLANSMPTKASPSSE